MMRLAGSKSSWVAGAIAVAVLGGVAALVTVMWEEIGDVELSAAGWVALVFGVVAALALGIGLMALLFYSEREGYDDPGGKS